MTAAIALLGNYLVPAFRESRAGSFVIMAPSGGVVGHWSHWEEANRGYSVIVECDNC